MDTAPRRHQTAQGDSKYGAACVGCRRRKQKCDAQLPSCGRCLRLKEQCSYETQVRRNPTPPVLSLLIRTYDFLESLVAIHDNVEVTVKHRITAYLSENPRPHFNQPTPSLDGGQTDEADEASPIQQNVREDRLGIRSDAQEDSSGRLQDEAQLESRDEIADPGGTSDVDELLMHMSLAENGQNGHFGVASMFWQDPPASVVKNLRRRVSRSYPHRVEVDRAIAARRSDPQDLWATDEVNVPEEEEAGVLKANSSLLRSWESLAFHKLELELDQSAAQLITHLLRVYFCWEYGIHCVVYRPVFIRDMALGGPNFNHFLLNVICALAARYSEVQSWPDSSITGDNPLGDSSGRRDIDQMFFDRAKSLLAEEMDKPSNVATIQGLLLLGQRECLCGHLSQGWMYTGMAFRAMRDLGIHLDCSRLPIFGFGMLSAEDREIRRRLFWAAFSWDKSISLTLGRTPTFNAFQNVSPGVIVDDTEDDDEWHPYALDDELKREYTLCPVQKSYTTLNFRHNIKLNEIIQKIIMRLYDGRSLRQHNAGFLSRIRQRLLSWFDDLPTVIKLQTNALPEHCPPPHIFAMNALYRAGWILLYRLFLPNIVPVNTNTSTSLSSEASRVCTTMAEEINALFLLYLKSFKLRNLSYTLLWSMYSAATVNAIDFRSSDPSVSGAASIRLGLSLHVLEKASSQSPGATRPQRFMLIVNQSVEIIKQRLRSSTNGAKSSIEKRVRSSMDSGDPIKASPEIRLRRDDVRADLSSASSSTMPVFLDSVDDRQGSSHAQPTHDTLSWMPSDEYPASQELSRWLSQTDNISPAHSTDTSGQQPPELAYPQGFHWYTAGQFGTDMLSGMPAMPSTQQTLDALSEYMFESTVQPSSAETLDLPGDFEWAGNNEWPRS